jgi:putative DNA methylase
MAQDLWYKPKLIEVSLPLEDINRESAREKSIRHGHPSTLHLWWARRPLAACRAVLFAQLVDDPSAHPDKFPTEEAQAVERKRLHDIISRLVKWENIHDRTLLDEVHQEILKSTNGNPPPILDPFAGGGSIPLEAQRLGLEAHASDLNPVAVLINKALIEIPPKWAGHKPVYPGVADERMSWPGATGLAEDVRRYGKWMRDEAEKRIGHLYPKVEVGGVDCTVIAWLWTRTVGCPSPACGGTMPLVKSFWLGKKKGKERYVVPIPAGNKVRFEIGGPDGVPPAGTVGRTGATCLMCGSPVKLSYIRNEGKAGRLGVQLMAIAAEGPRQRYYLAPDEEQQTAADVPRPGDVPESELSKNPRDIKAPTYGMSRWCDLFTNRQLTALTTFSDLVDEARDQAIIDGASASYSDSLATYLALIVSRVADRNSSICTWDSSTKMESLRNTFSRQAIPITWDFGEGNIFGEGSGNFADAGKFVSNVIISLPAVGVGSASPSNASARNYGGFLVATDPPYYDNVRYADLSDFFYVWLRRSIGRIYPDLFATVLTPKSDELVADSFRQKDPNTFFEDGFASVFRQVCAGTPIEYPTTVFYAFKQAETDDDGGHASTGWETLLEGMLSSGWAVTGTWPMRTELANRPMANNMNALASSVILSCRPRLVDAAFTDRRGLIEALRNELPKALQKLEHGKIAPVDLAQAAIGPGMAVFSRYAQVIEPDGSPMRVRTALSLINQALGEILSTIEGDVSPDTRFCVEWFKQHGFDDGLYGPADVLARGVDTSVAGLERAGVIRSRGGKVRLLSPEELPFEYDPSTDDRTSEWEICLHMAWRLHFSGVSDAAKLMVLARQVKSIDLENIRELSYLLYSIANEKRWAETALLFNELGTSWPDIEGASRQAGIIATARGGPGELPLDFSGDGDAGDDGGGDGDGDE